MRIDVLLADSAQVDVATNKVHALGLGWAMIGTPTPPTALVVLVSLAWTEANQKFRFEASLVDEDGHVVTAADAVGQQSPLRIEGEIEAGRPAGLPPGSPQTLPLAMNFAGGLPLTAGKRYEWRVTIGTPPTETTESAGFFPQSKRRLIRSRRRRPPRSDPSTGPCQPGSCACRPDTPRAAPKRRQSDSPHRESGWRRFRLSTAPRSHTPPH